MFIITRYEIGDTERKAIARILGLSRPADREQVRTYLQQQGELVILALTMPLMADSRPGSQPATGA